jgi:hypothetical protein
MATEPISDNQVVPVPSHSQLSAQNESLRLKVSALSTALTAAEKERDKWIAKENHARNEAATATWHELAAEARATEAEERATNLESAMLRVRVLYPLNEITSIIDAALEDR